MAISFSKNCVDLIKKFEGFRATPYECPGGYETIGYGTINDMDLEYVDKPRAETLVRNYLAEQALLLEKNLDVILNQNQIDAIGSFIYNLGFTNFKRSTLLKRINDGKHLEVPSELLRWKNAGGKPLRGLVLRRLEEGLLYVA